MWIARVLSGPQAGKVFPLRPGANMVGRSSQAQVHLLSSGVSKEHLKIDVFDGKLIVTDLGSRNGTFLNGAKIKSSVARAGDKLLLNDVFLEITQVPDQWVHHMQAAASRPTGPGPGYHGNAAIHMDPAPQHAREEDESPATPSSSPVHNVRHQAQQYLDDVVLPGIYKLPELLEFKWVLAMMIGAFILVVTSLSTIPLIRILKDSIEKESQQHAMTLASNLAQINRPALMSGQDTAVSVDMARRRPGVKEALIISNVDGNIIAPATRTGSYPDIPFIHEARLKGVADVSQVSGSEVVAVAPIEFFNAETGNQAVTAYAIVVYDMSSMSVDDGKTLSLFIQTLFIALIVGFLLFYFMYKMIEFPLKNLNSQLDVALREGRDDISVAYDFPTLKILASNINSALSRVGQSNSFASEGPREHDRNQEMAHVIDLIGFPAMAVMGEGEAIAHVNPAFEERTGLYASSLVNAGVEKISDQALRLSIGDLIARSRENPSQMLSNDLEFSGENYQVAVQAVMGTHNIAYFLIVLLPVENGGS